MKKWIIILTILVISNTYGQKKTDVWEAIDSVHKQILSNSSSLDTNSINLECYINKMYTGSFAFCKKKKRLALEQYLILISQYKLLDNKALSGISQSETIQAEANSSQVNNSYGVSQPDIIQTNNSNDSTQLNGEGLNSRIQELITLNKKIQHTQDSLWEKQHKKNIEELGNISENITTAIIDFHITNDKSEMRELKMKLNNKYVELKQLFACQVRANLKKKNKEN